MEVITLPAIERGSRVVVETAFGDRLEARALTGVIRGYDFPVVWVCREEQWAAAKGEGRDPEGMPCPASDVQLLPSFGSDARSFPSDGSGEGDER